MTGDLRYAAITAKRHTGPNQHLSDRSATRISGERRWDHLETRIDGHDVPSLVPARRRALVSQDRSGRRQRMGTESSSKRSRAGRRLRCGGVVLRSWRAAWAGERRRPSHRAASHRPEPSYGLLTSSATCEMVSKAGWAKRLVIPKAEEPDQPFRSSFELNGLHHG